MELKLSLDDKLVSTARRRAEAMGTTLEQLIRDYLAQMPGPEDSLDGIAKWRQVEASIARAKKPGPHERR